MLDLLVVGGGPAGLAVAVGAAQAGLTVAVFERRAGPIDKACGEGLMPGAVRALAALGIDPAGSAIRGIRYHEGKNTATADFSAGPGRGVRRTALHAALRAAVDVAGVPVHERAVRGVVQRGDHVEVDGIRARFVAAADGLHSPLRRALGLGASSRSPSRWGLRRHYAVAPTSAYVDVHWSPHAEAYVTPVGNDTVGVAILSSVRGAYDDQLAAFPALAASLRGAEAASTVRGAGPLRQRTRGRVAGRVLFVGDAAGYVDALTGEGMAMAFGAAAELVSCVLAGDPVSYEQAWRRVSRRSRWLTAGLLEARRVPPVRRLLVPTAARLPRVFGAAVNQLAG